MRTVAATTSAWELRPHTAIRDNKHPTVPVVAVSRHAWKALFGRLR
ncbi:DUF397 domain-containing protein [Streptomyces sp. NPDC049541]